jgi:hypothetical protein
MSDITPEQSAALRAPFRPDQIGKIPKGKLKLDYVGHADVTDRLLQVDPLWTWEPVAFGANGLPAIDVDGLWIKLTICGVTRYGFGDAGHSTGPNAVKEMIGDAIRNAAMRFGVALDLWSKSEAVPAQPEKPEIKTDPQFLADALDGLTEATDTESLAVVAGFIKQAVADGKCSIADRDNLQRRYATKLKELGA